MSLTEYTIPGMHIRDRAVPVPLDWAAPDGPMIEVFFREVSDPAKKNAELPLLCFLQGGPGGKSPRPISGSESWLAEALKTHRVILPDQRGTGRSAPIDGATMAALPSAEAAGDFLACFRADSIVADFDHIRLTVYDGARWSTLGQSFGGFLTLTYLSKFPEALAACYVTGGLPSIHPDADTVYRRTYPRVADKNARHFKRFPGDADRLSAIADILDGTEVHLPDGDRLTTRRLQTVGLDLGMGQGSERLHWLLDEAFAVSGGLSDHFLSEVMRLTSFRSDPLFAAIHEAIYGEGTGATAWSAERLRREFPVFDPSARPLYFTGEMIYPWMFDEIAALRPFRDGAEALARRTEFSQLYDPARLAANDVPVAAAIYHDDMFVDEELSRQTAAAVGNLDYWITNTYEHDGLHRSTEVLSRLVAMVEDKGGPLS